jgi:hypothetical protein
LSNHSANITSSTLQASHPLGASANSTMPITTAPGVDM